MTKISWSGAWLPVIHRMSPRTGRPTVALSIDDGPSDATDAILEALRAAQGSATFFLSGSRVRERPAMAERIVRAGHPVFGHGIEHVRLDKEPEERILSDLEESETLLARLRPTPAPYLVRLPYAAGRREPRVHQAIRRWRSDAQLAHWSHSTEDYEIAPKCASADEVTARCEETVARLLASEDLDGAIILMHDDPFDVPSTLTGMVTEILAERLIGGLTDRGFRITCIEPLASSALSSRFILEK